MKETTFEVKTGQQDVTGFNPYPNDDGQFWGGERKYTTRRTSGYYKVVAIALD
ncbi:MAG: hypothetical protein KKF50_02420 [Nanoarchaeota archaeon]|nr:hypothetical protein [Nanoarchaeota archaeon]